MIKLWVNSRKNRRINTYFERYQDVVENLLIEVFLRLFYHVVNKVYILYINQLSYQKLNVRIY